MPLCSVEIPGRVDQEVVRNAQKLAGEALDIAHKHLKVPDPEDLEINVIKGEGKQAKILVSYTVGPNVYPDYADPSFNPTKEQVFEAGEKIQEQASQSGLEVAQTTIEAWENTTFIFRSSKASKPIPPGEDLGEVGLSIKKPQLRLILSPKKLQGPTALPRETEPTTEPEPNLKFIEGVGKKLSEVLGLPEDSPIPVHVQPTLFADTDIAVELDCQPILGYQIPEEAMTYVAQLIEQELNQNPSTKDGSAEVWVRQGQPVTHRFTSK